MRCLLALAVASAALPASAADMPKRTNVLFLIADDLNCRHRLLRPQDRQDAEHRPARGQGGALRPRVRANTPSATPAARPSSQDCGRRPRRVMDNTTPFRKPLPDVVTLPQLFRRERVLCRQPRQSVPPRGGANGERGGRADALVLGPRLRRPAVPGGPTGEGRNLTGGRQGWCHWRAADGARRGPGGRADRAEAVRLIGQTRDKPFFLAVGFHKPHDPFVSPKKYFEPYALDRMDVPASPAGDRLPEPVLASRAGRTRTSSTSSARPRRGSSCGPIYAGASFTDAQVGKVLDALERSGQAGHTVVVFIGDHGYQLGVRNWWNKVTLFERSCRAADRVRTGREGERQGDRRPSPSSWTFTRRSRTSAA